MVSKISLSNIESSFDTFQPKRNFFRRFSKRSSVAILLRSADRSPEILMIERAERLGDPWSGHMAFPGGHSEKNDANSYSTVLRETSEEMGVELKGCSRHIGRLSDLKIRSVGFGMVVSPFVFLFFDTVVFKKNHEVSSFVWIPLSFFMNKKNRSMMTWERGYSNIQLPCYKYRGHTVWGLSLMMIEELIKVVSARHMMV